VEFLSVLSVEQEVDVLAQREGVIVELACEEGSRVEKGAVLARLDDRSLVAELDRARDNLQVANENVKYNEAEFKARQAAYRRALELRKYGLKSDADVEEAEFRATGAQHDLESWRAVVERSQAEIRLAELEVEKTRISAPFSGVVTRRYVRFGQGLLKDEKCFRLSQLAPLLVRFLVPETAARQPKTGMLVKLSLVSDSNRIFAARVQKVSPTVDPASGSYEVTVYLTAPDLSDLRPGMAVRVLWPGGSPSSKP
jgi:membrane fusion protein (multidrug efflux system)